MRRSKEYLAWMENPLTGGLVEWKYEEKERWVHTLSPLLLPADLPCSIKWFSVQRNT
jgi:hypothetical protein